MALINMKSNLAKGIGSRQSPQSFTDGHSATTITGAKTFPTPPRTKIESKVFSAINHQGEELKFQFNDKFETQTILERQTPGLQKYYDRAFSQTDPIGARNNNRLGFDEPFMLREIGDRWGPGNLGSIDGGIVRAGIVTQAARTVADVQRIGKFLLTPRGVGFIAKQNILQGLNAGGPVISPLGGELQQILAKKLGKSKLLLEPKQQRFSTGRDIVGSTPPTVQEMKGSDIRTWRKSSIIDSLPLGAHYVRHKIPAGSPSIQLVKNVSNFVVDMGGGVLKFIDGVDVAFPHVSLNPSFRAGGILTGLSKVGTGIIDIFPNIYDTAKIGVQALGEGIGGIVRGIKIPINTLGRMFSLTSMFPFLIDIPTPRTPNLSGIANILGGLADTTANLLKGIGGGIASALGGIKLPSISLPPMPNFPSLPDLGLSSLPNPFKLIGNAFKGINIGFPKFSGRGGLNLGAIARGVSSLFPLVRLNADITKGSLSFDMAAFDMGKAKFQAGLQNLIKLPNALDLVGDKAFGEDSMKRPDWLNGGKRYGIAISQPIAAGPDVREIDSREGGTRRSKQAPFTDQPKRYYTIAQPSVGQDFKGSLRNIYEDNFEYTITINQKYDELGGSLGINIQDNWDHDEPFAIAAGFAAGAYWGVEDKNFPLNTEKRFSDKPITVKFPKNTENHSADRLGNKIQRYEMLSYGQLGEDNRYGDTGQKADVVRGLGSQGHTGRLVADDEMGVVRMSSDGKYGSILQDTINLHPYGGSTISEDINDTNIDFVPFKFRDMVNGKWIIFRAILESISDTSSPEYAEESYIGRPDKVYAYRGSTRNLNVTFKVSPKSVQELVTLWEKMNYLRGLTYPSIENNRMIAPFASITIGDMFDKLPVLLQSLNYSIDTASTWEIKPGLRLPKLIQVSADMRVVEPVLPQTTGKFYDLDWLKDDGVFGTFDVDPKEMASLAPNRVKYDRGQPTTENSGRADHAYTHTGDHDFPHLFEELGITGVPSDTYNKLKAGEDAIKAAKAVIDGLKSNINVPNVDIPIPAIPFKF